MKTKLILVLLAFPLFVMANNHPKYKGRYTKEKKITKEYPVNPDARLKIDNSYGNVNVSSWNQNTIVIEVLVKTNGNDEDEVQEKLDEINVNFSGSSSFVSAAVSYTHLTLPTKA